MNDSSTGVTGLGVSGTGVPGVVPGVGASSSSGSRRPDPGSSVAARVAWLLSLTLLAVLVILHVRDAAAEAKVNAIRDVSVEPSAPSSSDPFLMNAKMMVKLFHSGMVADPNSAAMLQANIDAGVATDVDRLRAVMLKADMAGDAEAISSLEAARSVVANRKDAEGKVLEPPAWWTEDTARLEAVLAGNETGISANLYSLKERHGWFAEVLATRRLEMSDSARVAAVGGGGVLMLLILVAGVVVFSAFVGAMIAGVFVIVGLTKGRFRPAFVPPLPGGSVYLETLVAFLIGFLGLKVVLPLALTATGVMKAGVEPPDWLTTFSLACQWLLLPLIFWPLLRGVSWERC